MVEDGGRMASTRPAPCRELFLPQGGGGGGGGGGRTSPLRKAERLGGYGNICSRTEGPKTLDEKWREAQHRSEIEYGIWDCFFSLFSLCSSVLFLAEQR